MSDACESCETFEAWGKAAQGPDEDPGGSIGQTHPLAHHSMDVAAVLRGLLELPVTRNRLEVAAKRQLTNRDLARLAALAFLHDIGKLHPHFQAKRWPKKYWRGAKGGHTNESCAFICLASKWSTHPFHDVLGEMAAWGPSTEPLLVAMFSHHGRPVSPPPVPTLSEWPRLSHYDWHEQAKIMVRALRRWFPLAFEPGPTLPNEAPFQHLVAGLVALADWIGSSKHFFPYAEPFQLEYDNVARSNAHKALEAIGQCPRVGLGRPPSFRELTGFAPNPAQSAIGSVDPTTKLVILEAETGSGKTEAALLHFAQILYAGQVSSLYFALPTRAAARQLHGRVQKALRRIYGNDAPEAVLAVPGALKAGDHEAVRLPGWEVRWDDDGPVHSRWAAEHATRFLSAEVAVGTVDQAMLAGLTVKHAHMRGSALSRSLLVVDEVHASDPYMTTILKNLLDAHLAVGGHALLMSATLGSRSRARWRNERTPTFDEAKTVPYPAVWIAGDPTPRAPQSVGAKDKVVEPELVATMAAEEAAAIAVAAARKGARVLVIRNTVEQAVATWRSVQELGAEELLLQVAGGPALHHGRFAAEDRARLDEAVEAALSTASNRPIEGRIVVGTQTLEQSLDIDADFLVTDLCPMDVLLQRVGRLHRHDLRRPFGFAKARVAVMVPEGGLAPLVKPDFENGLGAWKTQDGEYHFIYGDLAVLELTRRLAHSRPEWRIPGMNRELVEGATHPDRIEQLLDELGDAWRTYQDNMVSVGAAQQMLASLGLLDRWREYGEKLFPSADENVQTRLGEEGIVRDFEPVEGPFGRQVTRITLPSHWSRRGMGEAPIEVEDCGGSLALSIGDVSFEYSRAGLLKTPETVPKLP
ncbi:MAG: CRISPR-associated helicase Cas3' [Gammaproteobacteria bacterium]|nr:CRISPR-associated helicase Cas3' [Gammaproteobacteria bacterium]